MFFQITTSINANNALSGTNALNAGALDAVILISAITIVILATLIFVALKLIRHSIVKSNLLASGDKALITYRVLVPKFKNDQDLKGGFTVQQLQEKVAIAETFYAAIGGLKAQKGFKAWLMGRSDALALELVSHKGLITFYLTVPNYLQTFVEQQLQAQYPDAQLDIVEDYNIFQPQSVIVGGFLKLKRDTTVPIKTFKNMEVDPLNAITNALSKVPDDEGVAVQYVVRSAKKEWRSKGRRIAKHMQKGMSYEEALKGGESGWKSIFQSKEKRDEAKADLAQRRMTKNEEEMVGGIGEKLSKAGMDVNIRIIAATKTTIGAQAQLTQVLQAFSQYNIYEFGNAFEHKIPKSKKQLIRDFIYRRFDDKQGIVLNTEEMTSLWHLPLPTTETPKINWLLARTQPAPSGLPNAGLHIGYNEFRGHRTDVYMEDPDRQRHMYVVGKTGSGKSYFLRYMAVQDIKAGKGVCVIDPHGDLVDAIMGSIPKERIDDVIYFNPSDMDRPMGLNMLEAGNENMRDFAVQEMISIFYMLFPPEMMGPMFEHNMRNFMLTLMADLNNPGTIVEIPRMIADSKFQQEWIAKVKDPVVRSFWEDEMAKTSDYHKSEMMGYLVSKVGRFVENEMMRNIIGQSRSAFDFRKIMDEGKILLVNLSKGATGEVNANLIGLIIVAKLQMAAFTRTDIPEDDRRDFYLYIDEFQNFITPSIATILSEARKYHLNLVLAHQYMGQLIKDGKTEIRDAVLGNVGSMLVSRVGPEDVEVLGKVFEPIFTPYDLMNTDKFTWNAKLIVRNAQVQPFTLKTVAPDKPNEELAQKLKQISRLQYGRDKKAVEEDIAERAGIGKLKAPAPQPQAPLTR